jgi:DNA polymerase-3 subunit epsilon
MPPALTPWREAELCVIDLETTGLDAATDEIISFATVPIVGGRARPGDGTYRLVRPHRMPEAETIVIHGLRSEDLVAARTLSEVLDDLLAAITGRPIVAHVATIEERFLTGALSAADIELRNPLIDTAKLATELFARRDRPAPDPIALAALAGALGLPVHRRHEADGDALTTAQVFLALATQLDSYEPQTIGSLVTTGRRASRWTRLRRAVGSLRLRRS